MRLIGTVSSHSMHGSSQCGDFLSELYEVRAEPETFGECPASANFFSLPDSRKTLARFVPCTARLVASMVGS